MTSGCAECMYRILVCLLRARLSANPPTDWHLHAHCTYSHIQKSLHVSTKPPILLLNFWYSHSDRHTHNSIQAAKKNVFSYYAPISPPLFTFIPFEVTKNYFIKFENRSWSHWIMQIIHDLTFSTLISNSVYFTMQNNVIVFYFWNINGSRTDSRNKMAKYRNMRWLPINFGFEMLKWHEAEMEGFLINANWISRCARV